MGFEMIEGGGGDPPKTPSPKGTPQTERATALLMLGLKTLSQRALVAVDNLFLLLSVGSAWWLWASTPSPNPNQIVSLSIYGLLILAANWLVRR
jgi:hypothetical protein